MSLLMVLVSVGLFFATGGNFWIDFWGGTFIEIKTDGPADISGVCNNFGYLGLGDVSIHEFGSSEEVLIQLQSLDGEEKTQRGALANVSTALGEKDLPLVGTEIVWS